MPVSGFRVAKVLKWCPDWAHERLTELRAVAGRQIFYADNRWNRQNILLSYRKRNRMGRWTEKCGSTVS
jgi:hypothetical protein